MANEPINLYELEAIAQQTLALSEWDYIAGGATDEITLARTRSVFDHIALRPRMLAGIPGADLTTTVLGHRIPAPFMLSPCGGHRRAHPEAELATTRGAGSFGTVHAISANCSVPPEEVARVADAPLWYQTYFYRDREQTVDRVHMAEDNGYSAICVTLDAVWPPKRERNIRNAYQRQPRADEAKIAPQGPEVQQAKFDAGMSSRRAVDPGATWDDVAWLRSITNLPIVFKGVITREDAALCAEHGVDALIVSNHGGRNLDTTIPTIEALPEVAEAAGPNVQVYLDGGIRRGTDVVKALALGANAVMLGRPLFWGLAYNGADGVAHMLDILRDEVETTMVMCGKGSVDAIGRDAVARLPELPKAY